MTPLNQTAKTWLTGTFGPDVVFDEPMKDHTSFRVGGPAEAFVIPSHKNDLVLLVQWAHKNGISCKPLGKGSNILVRDNGISGIVVSLKKCLAAIHHDDCDPSGPLVVAEAGVRLSALCAYAAKEGFKGLNLALGIPGTVGGGIRVNAGTAQGSLGDRIESIGVLMPEGTTRTIDRQDLAFSYRALGWPEEMTGKGEAEPVILEGVFRLEKADPNEIETAARTHLNERKQHQPLNKPNAGCIFKNPATGRAAGKLIDMAGLKGRCVGDAEISGVHANFIVNRGRATARDILSLVDLVQQTIYEQFGIQLETEVEIVGK